MTAKRRKEGSYGEDFPEFSGIAAAQVSQLKVSSEEDIERTAHDLGVVFKKRLAALPRDYSGIQTDVQETKCKTHPGSITYEQARKQTNIIWEGSEQSCTRDVLYYREVLLFLTELKHYKLLPRDGPQYAKLYPYINGATPESWSEMLIRRIGLDLFTETILVGGEKAGEYVCLTFFTQSSGVLPLVVILEPNSSCLYRLKTFGITDSRDSQDINCY